MLGIGEIAIIGGALVLIFGASRLPKLGKAIGEGIREMKACIKEGSKSPEEPSSKPENQPESGKDKG